MDRPAANLAGRHDDVAAVGLQHAGGGPMGVPKNRVGHAAGEQRHASPARPIAGSTCGSARLGLGQAAAACGPTAAIARATAASGPRLRPPGRAPAAAPGGPKPAISASDRDKETGRTESSDGTNRFGCRSASSRIAPSRCETARSAGRIARRRGRRFRTPGNRDTAPNAGEPRASTGAGRRSRRASDKSGRGGCRFRCPFPDTSDRPTCTGRSGRNRETADSRCPSRAVAGRAAGAIAGPSAGLRRRDGFQRRRVITSQYTKRPGLSRFSGSNCGFDLPHPRLGRPSLRPKPLAASARRRRSTTTPPARPPAATAAGCNRPISCRETAAAGKSAKRTIDDAAAGVGLDRSGRVDLENQADKIDHGARPQARLDHQRAGGECPIGRRQTRSAGAKRRRSPPARAFRSWRCPTRAIRRASDRPSRRLRPRCRPARPAANRPAWLPAGRQNRLPCRAGDQFDRRGPNGRSDQAGQQLLRRNRPNRASRQATIADCAGRGLVRSVIWVITPNVPSEPVSSLQKS